MQTCYFYKIVYSENMKSIHLKKSNPKGKSTSYGAGLPDKPGVYFFKHKGQILYIGKATSIKDRTKSYFAKDLFNTRGPLIVDMVVKANKIDWVETESVLEALILEAELIKKHQPYYNTREKDDKSFNFVCIIKGPLPQVLIVRGTNIKNQVFSKVFGPYTSGTQLREAMKIIRRIFPYIDASSSQKMNYEFYRQLGLTPDVGNQELEFAYRKNITNLKLFFQGKKKKIVLNLKKEMNLYAKNREFERANEIKKRIFALTHINDIALIKNSLEPRTSLLEPNFRIESYDIAHMGGKNMVGVMTVVSDGEVEKREYKKFKIRTQSDANDTGALKEVLERRLAHTEWLFPNLIVVDGGVAQLNTANLVLKKLNINIPVVSVLKDERHKPKDILGAKDFAEKYKREILLANSEAHRFAIAYHKKIRRKNFLI